MTHTGPSSILALLEAPRDYSGKPTIKKITLLVPGLPSAALPRYTEVGQIAAEAAAAAGVVHASQVLQAVHTGLWLLVLGRQLW